MSWFKRAFRFLTAQGIARHPIAKLADAGDGELIRVFGRIHADETLTAPITGRACVAWVVWLERDGLPLLRAADVDVTPFWLDDDSDRALVQPVAVASRLQLAVSVTEEPSALSERARAFLAERGYRNGGLWVREASLLPRATVTILGQLSVVREESRTSYRDAPLGERELRLIDVMISNRSELF